MDNLNIQGFGHTFRDSGKVAPLQAADVLAYETSKMCSGIIEKGNFDERHPMRVLGKIPRKATIWDMGNLTGICRDLPQRGSVPDWMIYGLGQERKKRAVGIQRAVRRLRDLPNL